MPPFPRRLESKFTALDLAPTTDTGAFEGYAALFSREDLGRDVILPGAFAASLAKRGAKRVRMLYQHDPAEPIGVWDEIREDGKGLYVRGRLSLDVARAREVHALMRDRAIDGLSIGFNVRAADRDKATGIRRIAELDLWEISVVTFPMMPEARIGAVKSQPFARHTPTPREFERWLTQDAGLTRSEARALMAQGFKGLAARRDAGHPSSAAGRYRLVTAIERATDLLRASIPSTSIHPTSIN